MLSINAINYYTLIRDKLSELQEIINFIKANDPIDEKQNIIISILKSSVSSNSGYYIYNSEKPANSTSEVICSNYNKKFSAFKKTFSPFTFYGKLATVKNEVLAIFKEYGYEDENVISMLDNLNELAMLYENIIQNNDDKKDVVIFFDAAEKYISEYQSVISSIDQFINVLTNNIKETLQPNTRMLEIQLLDVKYNVGQFAEILQHLDEAYSSFARLVPNTNITQLQIVKIESGSLLSKILGNDNIIEVLGIALKRIVNHVYYTNTKEGKLDLNNQLMQSISNDVELLDKFKAMGVDMSEGQQNLVDTFNVATKQLHSIASMAPRIKIDNEELKVKDPQRYLEYTTKYLIETTDTTNDNDDNDKTELPI